MSASITSDQFIQFNNDIPHEFHDVNKLDRSSQIAFFRRFLSSVPSAYASLDVSRMTLLYFVLSALDVLDAIDHVVDTPAPIMRADDTSDALACTLRQALIEWIYAQQVHPDAHYTPSTVARAGFKGGPYTGASHHPMRVCCVA